MEDEVLDRIDGIIRRQWKGSDRVGRILDRINGMIRRQCKGSDRVEGREWT